MLQILRNTTSCHTANPKLNKLVQITFDIPLYKIQITRWYITNSRGVLWLRKIGNLISTSVKFNVPEASPTYLAIVLFQWHALEKALVMKRGLVKAVRNLKSILLSLFANCVSLEKLIKCLKVQFLISKVRLIITV